MPGLENATIRICTIYAYTYVHEHTPLAKPGFCSGGRISCKPNTGALLSTSINKNDDSKGPNYCALRGTRTDSDNDSKHIGAGMDILALPLAVIIVTFIVQIVIHVTMIATMVRIIIIRKRTIKLVRLIVTATVVEIVAIMTVLMIVVLIVPVAVMILTLILVERMEVVIVVLTALILVVIRTTIICSKKLNIDTNHNNSNSCSSTATIATINTNYGSSNGGNHRISTHTNVKNC